jgi:hypothetical protein
MNHNMFCYVICIIFIALFGESLVSGITDNQVNKLSSKVFEIVVSPTLESTCILYLLY